MGCENTKEKVESELIKMKMARSEVQMERYNQIQLLKEMDGTEIKPSIIPDYIDHDFIKQKLLNGNSTILTQGASSKKVRNTHRRAKSCAIKKKTSRINGELGVNSGTKKLIKGKRKRAKL